MKRSVNPSTYPSLSHGLRNGVYIVYCQEPARPQGDVRKNSGHSTSLDKLTPRDPGSGKPNVEDTTCSSTRPFLHAGVLSVPSSTRTRETLRRSNQRTSDILGDDDSLTPNLPRPEEFTNPLNDKSYTVKTFVTPSTYR